MNSKTYELKRLSHLHRYILKYVFEPLSDTEMELISEYEYLKLKYPDWEHERNKNHSEKMRKKNKVRKTRIRVNIGTPDNLAAYLKSKTKP